MFFYPGQVLAEDQLDKVLRMPLELLMNLEVETPSKNLQRQADAPGTVIVITQEQIRERGYVNLIDLLEDQPGIDVNHKSVEEFFNQVAIHGNVGNNKFIIMQNGVRISSPTGEHIPISDNFPLFNIKQVEIIFGPASALYGRDAFTGVINMITKKAKAIRGIETSAAIGSDDYYYGYFNYGDSLTEKLDATFGGHWQSSQNPDLSKDYSRAFEKVDLFRNGELFRSADSREPFTAETNSYSVYAKLDYDDRFTVGMNRSFMNHPTTVGVKPENTLFGDDAAWKSELQTYYGQFKFDVNEKLSGKFSFDYSIYETLPDTKFTNNFSDFGAFKYAKGDRLMLEQQINYDLSADQKLIGGVIFQDFNSLPKSTDLPEPFDTDKDPEDQALFHLGANNMLPIKFFEVGYQNYGAYIQVQSRWNDRISTVIGARLDYETRFGATVNPRGGVIVKPDSKTVLKLFYGEAFFAPVPNFQFAFFGSFTGEKDSQGRFISNFFHIPNENLEPEKTRTLEFVITRNFTPNFQASLTGYYSWVDDIVFNVTEGFDSEFIEGGIIRFTSTNANDGKARIHGFDFRANYHTDINRLFHLKLWGNYSFVDGEIERFNGEIGDLPVVAKNKVKSGLTLKYLQKFFITPRVIWVGRTSHFIDKRSEKVSSYALVNLFAGAENVYKDLSVYLNIRNLPDVRYFNAGGGSNSFGSSPQDPRRIFLWLKYKF